MIYGAILEKGERWYTDMSKIVDILGNKINEYNWLITDFMFNEADVIQGEYGFLSGEQLINMSKKNMQWIWAVVSGIKKEIPLDEILKYPLPYADGYSGFWKNPLSIQHPLADVEIVPWDSSLTLLIAKDKELVDMYRKKFPLSEDLERYNEQFA